MKKESYYQTSVFSLVGKYIKLSDWYGFETLDADADPEAFNNLLEEDSGWCHSLRNPYQPLNPAGCINLTSEGVTTFNSLLMGHRYYYENLPFAHFLPLLGRLNAPLFLVQAGTIGQRIRVLAEPVEIEAALARGKDKLVLQAGLVVDGQRFTMMKESLEIVQQDPAWVLAGSYLAPVKNPQSLSLVATLPLTIPPAQEEKFREHYLRDIAERVPLKGDMVTWDDVEADPVPRLFLEDEDGKLRASMRFGYGDFEVPSQSQPDPLTLIDQPDSWGFVRIHRQSE